MKLSGYNYGRLLMKEYRDTSQLTAAEKSTLALGLPQCDPTHTEHNMEGMDYR